MISVILPAFNEEKNIARTAETLSGILTSANIPYELLFVDDGSTDGTWTEIRKASNSNPQIRGLHFSRNFGKESAMFAGLEKAEGDCCGNRAMKLWKASRKTAERSPAHTALPQTPFMP